MVLSKSNYLTYLKHPAWLWLEKHDKIMLPEIDDDTQGIFDAGNLFEEYAEQLFPNGFRLGYKTNGEFDGTKYWGLPEATKDALAGENTVFFQGRLEVDGITCISTSSSVMLWVRTISTRLNRVPKLSQNMNMI